MSIETTLFLFGITLTVLIPVFGFLSAIIIGSKIQKNMIADILRREQITIDRYGRDPISTLRQVHSEREIESSALIVTTLAIGPNWWHQFVSRIQSIFGGNLHHYDKIIAIGRNEAMQRLRDVAAEDGWDEVINVRLETSRLSPMVSSKEGTKAIELCAYGTGVKYA